MALIGNRYVDYLPAILREGPFIAPFLAGFERVLSGPPPGSTVPPGVTPPRGIEETLDRAHTFVNPLDPNGDHAPDDFLPWLAGWLATTLKDEWSPETRRAFLSKIVSLYQKRGTADGLREVLNLHTTGASVLDHDDDAAPPHFNQASPAHLFKVIVEVSGGAEAVAKKIRQVISIVNQWKPAHTYYYIEFTLLGMQINNESCTPQLLTDPSFSAAPCNPDFGPGVQIGVTTLVGSSSKAPEIKLEALQINDDPALYPEFGAGILVGVNMLLGTEP